MYLDIQNNVDQHVMSDGVESLEKLPDANTLNQTNSNLPHQFAHAYNRPYSRAILN